MEIIVKNVNAKFIGLNKFENKETGEVSYNIDIQFIYGNGEKLFKKIEKIYLNDVDIDDIKELENLEMGTDLQSLTTLRF